MLNASRHRRAQAKVVVAALCWSSLACSDSEPSAPTITSWSDLAFGAQNVVWTTDDSQGAWAMVPALDDQRVYFEQYSAPGGSSHLIALNRTTGSVHWSGSIVTAENAAIAGDVIGAVWGSLEVFRRSTGEKQYTASPPGTSFSSNVVTDGSRFYVLTYNTGHALAVNAASGTVAWDVTLAGAATGTYGRGVTLAGDRVIVVLRYARPSQSTTISDSSIVASLDAATGALHWRVVLTPTSLQDPWIVEPAVVFGEYAFVVTLKHDVIALSLATGAQAWHFDAAFGAPTTGSSGLAVCDGKVLAPTGDLGLVALNAQTGVELWHAPVTDGSLYTVHCLNGTVVTKGSLLNVLSAESGATLGTYPIAELSGGPAALPAGFYITSALFDGTWIYAGTTSGYAKFKAP